MSKEAKRPNSRWGYGKRRELTPELARKAGYKGDLRESRGWWRGAQVSGKSCIPDAAN